MNSKILNLGAKGLMVILILVGAILTYLVMSDGDPLAMNELEIRALGEEVAIQENKAEELGQAELNSYVLEEGTKIKNDLLLTQRQHVSTVVDYSGFLLMVISALIIVAIVVGIFVDPKKFIISIISVAGFVLLIIAIYYMVGTDPPGHLVQKEADALVAPSNLLFTAENWQIAGAAIVSMGVLLGLTVVTLVAGEVVKMFK